MQIQRLGANDRTLLDAALRAFAGFQERSSGGFVADPGNLILVASEGTTVVGWAWGHEFPRPSGGRTLVLYRIDVAEPSRRPGAARSLLDAFVEQARERGLEGMRLFTDAGGEAARALHPGAGSPHGQGQSYWWVFE